MKRILLLFVSLLFVTLRGQTTYEDQGFNFTVYNNEARLVRYAGSSPSITVPTSLKNGVSAYPVTQIISIITRTKDYYCSDIYIPSSVVLYKSYLTTLEICPRTIVIENGDFSIEKDQHPIRIGNNDNFLLDNIIVLSPCAKSVEEIAGQTAYLAKPGEITVHLANDQTLVVQMYLCGRSADKRNTFGQTRIDDLCSALQKKGIILSNIRAIDLRNLNSAGSNTFILEAMDISQRCPNATILTHEGQIADKVDYTAPTTDFNGLISYQRTNTQYWNSVCLPFAIKESDFPEGTSIYCLKEIKDNKVYLSRIEDGASVSAGVPCYIYCDSNTPWDIQIANGTIAANQAPVDQESDGWKLVGSFVNSSLGTGKYKLNSAGDAFVTTTQSSTVTAFRCYLAPTNPSTAPARLEVGVDEEAEITLVPNDREPQRVKLYDLMGRPRRENAPGLFIRCK